MSSDKINTIQNWLKSKKVKNIQAFLGFTNFYHQFIYSYSDIATLLIWLIWKDTSWNFDLIYYKVFNTLKKAFVSTLILIH